MGEWELPSYPMQWGENETVWARARLHQSGMRFSHGCQILQNVESGLHALYRELPFLWGSSLRRFSHLLEQQSAERLTAPASWSVHLNNENSGAANLDSLWCVYTPTCNHACDKECQPGTKASVQQYAHTYLSWCREIKSICSSPGCPCCGFHAPFPCSGLQ